MTGTAPVVLRWSHSAVEAEALHRAAYRLARSCTVEVAEQDGDWVVSLFARNGVDPEVAAHRFRQEVGDQNLRLTIGRRTDPLRNAVFAMAFSRLSETVERPQ